MRKSVLFFDSDNMVTLEMREKQTNLLDRIRERFHKFSRIKPSKRCQLARTCRRDSQTRTTRLYRAPSSQSHCSSWPVAATNDPSCTALVGQTGLSSRVVSASDCGVRGSRFESRRWQLCLSRQLLRYTVLSTGCSPLLQCLGRLSLPPFVGR